MRSKEWKIAGHATIEMALIFPMILFIIIWMTFFMIFLYDMSVVKSELIRVSAEASEIGEKKGDLASGKRKIVPKEGLIEKLSIFMGVDKSKSQASLRLQRRMRERLLMTSPDLLLFKSGKKEAVAQARVSFPWPFPGMQLIQLNGLSFVGKGVSPVNDWKEQLWLSEARKNKNDGKDKNIRREKDWRH